MSHYPSKLRDLDQSTVDQKLFSDRFSPTRFYELEVDFTNLTVHPCCKAAPQPIDVTKFAQTLDLTTETDIAERNLMLAGGKPKGCARCWRHEELSPTTASFRRLMNFFRRDLIDGLEAPRRSSSNRECST